MRHRTKQIIAAAWLAASGITVVLAQPAPVDPPANAQSADAKPVQGTVIGFNLTADGEPNGLLLKTGDGTLTQVNFPPPMAGDVTKAAKVGASVSVTTRPVPPRPAPPAGDDRPAPPPPPPADHPVGELVSLTVDGTTIPSKHREDGPAQHVEGKIARLNYTREGQVDGAVLEDGTLVHVGPKEAEDLKLAVGQTLSVDGTKPPKAGDAKVIHATQVNGTAINHPQPGPGGPPAP